LREPRIPLAVLADNAVVPLDVAGRNLRFIGLSFDNVLLRSDALWRAIAALVFPGLPVSLDQLRVIDFRSECALDGFEIWAKTI